MTSQAKLLLTGLAVALLSVAGEAIALAQIGKSKAAPRTAVRVPAADRSRIDGTGAGEKPERPQGNAVLEVRPVSPEMEAVLQAWEQHSSKIQKLQGNFVKFQYNSVFFTEKRSNGKFYYVHPDKGFYNVEGDKSKNLKPSKKEKGWKVEPGKDERWLCDGKTIYAINDSEKSYETHEIPADKRGKNIIDGPLPFLFGMKADEAKKRYELDLMKQEKGQIWIKAKPLRQQDLVNWKEATVILDAKTFLPQAVQLVEPDGALSVHTFFGLEQPDKRGLLDFRKLFPNDPLKLDIPKGYRLVSTNESAEPDRAGIAQIGPPLPPANKPKIQQAAHQKMAGFPALKQALETAQTADELEEARVLIGKIIERDKGATNPADRILTADHIKELSQVYQERRVELPRTPSRPGSR